MPTPPTPTTFDYSTTAQELAEIHADNPAALPEILSIATSLKVIYSLHVQHLLECGNHTEATADGDIGYAMLIALAAMEVAAYEIAFDMGVEELESGVPLRDELLMMGIDVKGGGE